MSFWQWADQHWFVFGVLAFVALCVLDAAITNTLNVWQRIAASRKEK